MGKRRLSGDSVHCEDEGFRELGWYVLATPDNLSDSFHNGFRRMRLVEITVRSRGKHLDCVLLLYMFRQYQNIRPPAFVAGLLERIEKGKGIDFTVNNDEVGIFRSFKDIVTGVGFADHAEIARACDKSLQAFTKYRIAVDQNYSHTQFLHMKIS